MWLLDQANLIKFSYGESFKWYRIIGNCEIKGSPDAEC